MTAERPLDLDRHNGTGTPMSDTTAHHAPAWPAPPIRFGVLLSAHRQPDQSEADVFARTLALAQSAEALGVDDLWVVEHHFTDTIPCPSALSLAAFLLGRTRRIRVGTAVTLLPLHSPLHVAEQAALLDHLSEGRFILGVGRGQQAPEYGSVGGGTRHWQEGLAEALDLVLAAWRGEVSAHSELYSFPRVAPVPRPLTRPCPAVYVAANSPATAALAAARGIPLLMYFDKTAEYQAELVAAHSKAAAAAGHPAHAYDHAFAAYAEVTDSSERARALMRDRARAALHGADAENRLDAVTDRLLAMHPVGDPETCVQRLVHTIRTSGCTRVLCQVEGRSTTDAALRNLGRLSTEVFPEVRARTAGAAPVVVRT